MTQPTTFKIVSEHHNCDDADTCNYEICVKTEGSRVHLHCLWSAYDGDILKSAWKCRSLQIRLTPCNCDIYVEGTADWMEAAANQYHREHAGAVVLVEQSVIGFNTDWNKAEWKWTRKVRP